jgi:hypothetical protein
LRSTSVVIRAWGEHLFVRGRLCAATAAWYSSNPSPIAADALSVCHLAVEALLGQRLRLDGEMVFQSRRGMAQDSSSVTDAKVAFAPAGAASDPRPGPPSHDRQCLARGRRSPQAGPGSPRRQHRGIDLNREVRRELYLPRRPPGYFVPIDEAFKRVGVSLRPIWESSISPLPVQCVNEPDAFFGPQQAMEPPAFAAVAPCQ